MRNWRIFAPAALLCLCIPPPLAAQQPDVCQSEPQPPSRVAPAGEDEHKDRVLVVSWVKPTALEGDSTPVDLDKAELDFLPANSALALSLLKPSADPCFQEEVKAPKKLETTDLQRLTQRQEPAETDFRWVTDGPERLRILVVRKADGSTSTATFTKVESRKSGLLTDLETIFKAALKAVLRAVPKPGDPGGGDADKPWCVVEELPVASSGARQELTVKVETGPKTPLEEACAAKPRNPEQEKVCAGTRTPDQEKICAETRTPEQTDLIETAKKLAANRKRLQAKLNRLKTESNLATDSSLQAQLLQTQAALEALGAGRGAATSTPPAPKTVEFKLLTGPREPFSFSVDLAVNKSEQLTLDDGVIKATDKAETYYLGFNYQLGDRFLDYRGAEWWKNLHFKAMIRASDNPLDSFGVGVGYKNLPLLRKIAASPWVAVTWTEEDAASTDTASGKNQGGRTGEVRFGLSFDLSILGDVLNPK